MLQVQDVSDLIFSYACRNAELYVWNKAMSGMGSCYICGNIKGNTGKFYDYDVLKSKIGVNNKAVHVSLVEKTLVKV